MAASGNVGMISWNRRVLQARANLNGGELDEGLPSDHKTKTRIRWCKTGLNGKGERGAKCLKDYGEEDVEDLTQDSAYHGGELVLGQPL